jgi:hypothetical protein
MSNSSCCWPSGRSEWRIAARVCAFQWRRTDPVVGESGFAETYIRGVRGADDIVWHILD